MRTSGFSFRVAGLIAGLGLLGAGCGDVDGGDVTGADPGDTGSGLTFEQFEAQTYREPETGLYIVNGDQPVDGVKELRAFYETYVEKGQLIVHTVNGVDAKWSDANKVNLTYCVSNNFGTNKTAVINAMSAAGGAWAAAANVKFVYVSAQDASCTASNTNVVFDVNPVNSGGQYLARAFFPNDTRANRNVLIDGSAFSPGTYTLAGILRHELGHTLGFRHEHTRPEAGTCFEDSNWRALTGYDPYSVMHYPQCNGSQTGDLVLTATDKAGAAALYGAPGGGGTPPPTGTVTTENFSGSVATGANANYGPFSVVAGSTFEAVLSGTSGDADLYVRFGAAPTTTTYDCRPYKSGSAETCTLTVPAGVTTAYVMVRGYSAASYALRVTYTKPSSSGGGTVTTQNYSGSVAAGAQTNYGPFSVVAGSTFQAVLSGSSGDADLYVRFGAAPTTSTWNCRPYLNGSNETCTVTVPAGTTSAYVGVRGYTAASYSLAVTYTKP